MEEQLKFYELIKKLDKIINIKLSKFFTNKGITPSQFNVLQILYKEKNSLIIGDLKKKIGGNADVTRLLYRLEDWKYITKYEGKNFREKQVIITSRGKRIVELLQDDYKKIISNTIRFNDRTMARVSKRLEIVINKEERGD